MSQFVFFRIVKKKLKLCGGCFVFCLYSSFFDSVCYRFQWVICPDIIINVVQSAYILWVWVVSLLSKFLYDITKVGHILTDINIIYNIINI